MAAITICIDLSAQENDIWYCFQFFPIYLPWTDRPGCYDLCFLLCVCVWIYLFIYFFIVQVRCMILIFVFWILSFKPAFSLSSSPSSRSSLVPIHFLPMKCYLHIWGCWYFSRQSWFQLVILPAQHIIWCTLHIS